MRGCKRTERRRARPREPSSSHTHGAQEGGGREELALLSRQTTGLAGLPYRENRPHEGPLSVEPEDDSAEGEQISLPLCVSGLQGDGLGPVPWNTPAPASDTSPVARRLPPWPPTEDANPLSRGPPCRGSAQSKRRTSGFGRSGRGNVSAQPRPSSSSPSAILDSPPDEML